jgi:tape measure domain-containing protein
MAAEDYSIRINVDSSSAQQAQRNLQNLNSTVTQTERELNNTSSAARSAAASLSGMANGTSSSAQSTARLAGQLNNLNGQLANTSSAARNSANEMSGLNRVLGAFGVATGIAGLAMLAKNILQVNIEMEALRARLNMTMPSMAAASNAFSLILKIAKETPQSIDEITKAFLLLRNSGLDTSEKSMRGWTDVASKFGGTADMLTGVIRQYGQANMKGALHAQDANAMIERGIPLYGLLTQVTGKSAGAIIKMMEAGELNNKIMEKALNLLFEMSSGSSAKAMDTMRGKIEGLGSAWSGFVDVLMSDKSEGFVKNILGGMSATLEFLTKKMSDDLDARIADLESKVSMAKKSIPENKNSAVYGVAYERYMQESIMLEQLKKQKQKGIDDVAKMDKAAIDTKKAQEIQAQVETDKAIANGDEVYLKKHMAAKLNAIKETDKEIIRQQAEKASISAKLAMSIVAVESTGNNKSISPVGAVGLMQVMPENFKKAGYTQQQVMDDSAIAVKLGLKVWQDSMDVAKQAVIKGTIEANQQAEFAAALYTTKHQTIYDRIKKNKGIFDINLFKEASDWWNKVSVGLELQNQSVSKSFAPYNKAASEAAQETKKLAHEQEQAAKKTDQAKQQIYENSPIGKYLTDMAELNKLYDDKSSVTYQDNAKKIADTFLKATVDLSAYNQELAKHKKYLEDITDYNATIDELTKNKQRGAITPTEYGLGVAQANAGLMNQATDKKIPVNQTSEVIDAKNIDESAKALTKLDDLAKKTTDSFKQIGDSGKMAFDGLLGGISAVAAAATNFGDVMEKLNENHTDYAKNYEKFMSDSTKSEEDKAKAKIGFEKENAAYQSASFKAEISGARQIAGAASKMFGEKSSARKAFHAIEVGLSIIEMAISAKKIAMNLVETVVGMQAGAAQFFAQSGWAGFAGVAAMMAVIAGLGFMGASSGGSSSSGAIPEYTKTTGGVLGDSEAQSKSVENVSAKLEEIHAREFPELKNISSSMENFVKSIDKMLIVVARTGIDLQMINTKSGGFFGSTKVSTVGGGIKINEQSVADLQAGNAFDAQVSSIIQTTKKSFFGGSKTRITEMLSGLDKSIGDGLSTVILSMSKNVASFWEYLGLDMKKGAEAIGGFSFSAYIKTFGMKDSEVTDALKNWTSMTYDQMITHVLGGFVKQFQAMGESIGDTLGRLVTDANSVKSSMRSAGMQVSLTGEDFVIFSQQMLDATGGLKNFVASMDALISKFVSKDVKADISASNILDTLKTDAVTKAASDLKVDLTPFTNFANDVKNNIPKTAEQISDMSVLAMKTVNDIDTKFQDLSLANNRFQKTDYTTAKEQAFVHENPKITDAMITLFSKWGVSKSDTLAEAEKKVGSSSTKWDAAFQPAIKHFIENESTKAKGESSLTAMGLPIDLLQLQSLEDSASKAVEPAKELTKALTNISTSTADTAQKLDDDGKRIGASYESILKKITTPNETLIRNQKAVVKSLSDKLVSGGDELVNSKVIAWLKSIGETAVITEKTLQRYSDSLTEQEKILKKLSDSGKYLMDFSRSIDSWVKNLRATSLGTPESQLKASQANFGEQMKLAQFGATAEIKRTALSGITGYADTYINALKNYYASSEEGVNAIEQVIKEVSGLEKGLSIQELQLNELQRIKDAIDDGTIAGDKNYQSLINATKQAGIDAKLNPTAENQLKYDAFASVILSIDKSKQEGKDAAFIDKLISGGQSLEVQTKILIESADFSLSQKESVINGVLADFNKQIGFNVSESFKSETDRVNASWKEVKLPTTETDNAKTSVTGLTGGLKDLNGQYDVVITKTVDTGAKIVDFSNTANNTKFGLNTESVAGTVASFEQITKSANDAKYAMESLAMADAAKRETTTKGNAFLESKATNAGYQGDLTDIDAMNAFLSPKPVITKQSKIATVDELKILGALSSKYNAMSETAAKASGLTKFANGGIANTASIFGEAGAEAAVPLPDGRTIPVTLSRDSANDSGETVAELREISRKQEIMINTLIAAAQESRKQNQVLVTEIEGLRTDTRLRRAA